MAKRQRQYTRRLIDLDFDRALDIQNKVAREAARIVVESGLYDLDVAKSKSAQRLGVKNKRHLPQNSLIQQEIMHFQAMPLNEQHTTLIRELRQIALQAMALLADFSPHLVGPVLQGCATKYSGVELHVFAETSESLDMFLTQKMIPFTLSQRRLQLCNNAVESFLTYHLHYKTIPMDVTIFPLPIHFIRPRDPISQGPVERASVSQLKELLA